MMATLQFEGAIDGISERQIEFIRCVLVDRGFSDDTVQVSIVGKAGDNYIANVKRVVVEKDGETFNMIAKVAPTTDIIRNKLPTVILFRNEHVMYTKILPKYTELEEEAIIPVDERLMYTTCYGSLSEEPNEIILLEDLLVSDFVMLDKFKSLTDDTVKVVFKNFAMLHSLSFVLKNMDPETYIELKNMLVHPWATRIGTEMLNMYFSQIEEDMIALIDDERDKKLIKGSLTKLPEAVFEKHNMYKDSKYGVIIHGDAWTNNILFKLESGKTTDCCFIDYQMSYVNSPVADILGMIFFCTDYETRSKHYHDWIDYYHSQLDKCLANFGLKINFIYPRNQFDTDLKSNGKVFFGFSLMLIGMLMKESHEAAFVNEALQTEKNFEEMLELTKLTKLDHSSIDRVKVKINGLIASFLELGYLEHK